MEAALLMMYRNNGRELGNRVLRMTKKCTQDQKVISPSKINQIYSLMNESIEKVQNPSEKLQRLETEYIQHLISMSICRQKQNNSQLKTFQSQ